jgi:hypothetical protein
MLSRLISVIIVTTCDGLLQWGALEGVMNRCEVLDEPRGGSACEQGRGPATSRSPPGLAVLAQGGRSPGPRRRQVMHYSAYPALGVKLTRRLLC